MSPLLWTCRSTRELAGALSQPGYPISADTVGRLLAEIGYSLQANMKSLEEGAAHPDRDQQFKHLNRQVGSFLKQEKNRVNAEGNENWKHEIYMNEISNSPSVKELLGKAVMDHKVQVNGDYSYFCEKKYGNNFAMVGPSGNRQFQLDKRLLISTQSTIAIDR